MKKDLPKVYVSKIDKEINSAQQVFYSFTKKTLNVDKSNVYQKINSIFKSPNYIYRKDVLIKTNDLEQQKTIIAKSGNNLLTIEKELINIDDIIDISVI